MVADSGEKLDGLIAHYLEDLFFGAESPARGSFAVAALQYAVPEVKSTPRPRVNAALKGYRRLVPARSRLPLPEIVLSWITAEMIRLDGGSRASRRKGLCLQLGYRCYLRPGEMAQLKWSQVLPPQAAGGAETASWRLLLHPLEEGTPSKTLTYDTCVPLGLPRGRELGNIAGAERAMCQLNDTVCGTTQSNLSKLFGRAARSLGLLALDPVLYRARHSGASTDRNPGARTLAEVQKRGRWATQTSVVRYEEGGGVERATGAPASPPPTHMRTVHESLYQILRGEVAAPPPPAG